MFNTILHRNILHNVRFNKLGQSPVVYYYCASYENLDLPAQRQRCDTSVNKLFVVSTHKPLLMRL